MRHILSSMLLVSCAALWSCNGSTEQKTDSASPAAAAETHSQAGVKDETSTPDIVKVAVGSKDHTTLVTAVKAADLVDDLSNAGPFTVFAPTNAAFDKLPAGTVEGLLKADKKESLEAILQHHVYVGVLKTDQLTDGQSLGMVDGTSIKITMQDGKPVINGKAHILASVPASNGIIHVVDEVITPGQ